MWNRCCGLASYGTNVPLEAAESARTLFQMQSVERQCADCVQKYANVQKYASIAIKYSLHAELQYAAHAKHACTPFRMHYIDYMLINVQDL